MVQFTKKETGNRNLYWNNWIWEQETGNWNIVNNFIGLTVWNLDSRLVVIHDGIL